MKKKQKKKKNKSQNAKEFQVKGKRKSINGKKSNAKSKKAKDVKEPPKQKKNKSKKKRKSYSLSNIEKISSKNSINTNQYLSSINKVNNSNSNSNKPNININIIPISNIKYSKAKKKKNIIYKNDINIYKHSIRKTSSTKKSLEKNNTIYYDLNDLDLNNLQYEIALIFDKRTYFQYYWSLLKKKQLILFTFLPSNDYNLFSLKLSLFLLSFSLYFTVNGFFFSDETMHKIHEDNGAFNIFYQIPQILYSSVISAIINAILKILSLSEKNILAIKRQSDINIAIKNAKNIEIYITIKFIIFFILSYLLLLFFWNFISSFCAVYINTQMILIKDTLVRFALSMAYPFAINLLPGIFRIPSLKSKNQKCLYVISSLIALI